MSVGQGIVGYGLHVLCVWLGLWCALTILDDSPANSILSLVAFLVAAEVAGLRTAQKRRFRYVQRHPSEHCSDVSGEPDRLNSRSTDKPFAIRCWCHPGDFTEAFGEMALIGASNCDGNLRE